MGAPPRTNGSAGLKPGREELVARTRCKMGTCEVSMPPSSPCSQLLSWITFETWRCEGGAWVQAKWGSGGRWAAGPR